MNLKALAEAFRDELDSRDCFLDAIVAWPEGDVRQRYFLDGAYPDALVGSARAVVFRQAKVVVVRDRTGASHVQPGGHIEPGETIELALRRELAEETGWQVGQVRPFCFKFVEPADRAANVEWFPNVHIVFVAEAISYDRRSRDRTQIEVGSSLVPVGQALRELSNDQAILLRAALRVRSGVHAANKLPRGSPN